MKFKIGDKVTIKQHKYGSCMRKKCATMTEEMRGLIGKTAKITKVRPKHYFINLDKETFSWSECMVEKSVKKDKTVKVKSDFKTVKEHSTYSLIDNEIKITAKVTRGGKISLLTTFGDKEFVFKNSNAKQVERVGMLIVASSKLKI